MNGQEGQQEPNPYYGELQAAQQQGDIFDPNQNQNNGQKRKSDGDPPAGGQKVSGVSSRASEVSNMLSLLY